MRGDDLEIGTDPTTGEPIVIRNEQLSRGVLIGGTPGIGKSHFLAEVFLRGIEDGRSGMFLDPHNNIQQILERMPVHRRRDVVLLSLVHHEHPPLWPVLDMARRSDELLTVADLMVESWRALHGEQSIGARAESMLAHSLLLVPQSELSPLELLAVLAHRSYRLALMGQKDAMGKDFALDAFWNGSMKTLPEPRIQEWAQSTENKLSRLLIHPFLRLATTGTPPARRSTVNQQLDFKWLLQDDLTKAMLIRSGTVACWHGDGEHHNFVQVGNQLDRYLLDHVSQTTVRSPAFPDGRPSYGFRGFADTDDPSLLSPDEYEQNVYPRVRDHVRRRRRRRGWTRFAEYELEDRGVQVKEALDIADLLDDQKIILVEVPEVFGAEVTNNAATFALMAAVLRGTRQLSLPASRRTPMMLVVDEAAKFITAGVERTLTELRKAEVQMVLGVQRLGQLGAVQALMRRGVVDTVGTVVCLGPGRQEVKEFSELLEVPAETLQDLGRGEAMVAGLGERWNLEDARKAELVTLREVKEDVSVQLRQASLARYCQSTEEAEATHLSRVRRVNAIRHGHDRNSGSKVKPAVVQ